MNMSAKTVETHWTEAEDIADRVERLSCHPLYESLGSVNQLRLFMEHHVFAVWDFMSLLKFLQAKFAPTEWPWLPPELPAAARFVNEIALCEESDHGVEDEQFISHFELYLSAMEEIGANTKPIGNFMRDIRWSGLGAGLSSRQIPLPRGGLPSRPSIFSDGARPMRWRRRSRWGGNVQFQTCSEDSSLGWALACRSHQFSIITLTDIWRSMIRPMGRSP